MKDDDTHIHIQWHTKLQIRSTRLQVIIYFATAKITIVHTLHMMQLLSSLNGI
jgi:hypothetical protein